MLHSSIMKFALVIFTVRNYCNVFTSVCQEFCPQRGVCTLHTGIHPHPRADIHPLDRHLPLGRHTPLDTNTHTHPRQTPHWADTPGQTHPQKDIPFLGRHPPETVIAADGTHPTGMLSCLKYCLHECFELVSCIFLCLVSVQSF